MKENFKIPRIGMRIIKSAAGVLACFAVNLLRGDSGLVFYSLLAVLWCVRDYRSETRKFAFQRTTGTVIGAVYGLVFLLATPAGYYDKTLAFGLIVALFIVLVLYTTVVLRQKQASYFSCVVFLSIVINHATDLNPYYFVWNRFLDTMIGIIVGIAINSIDPDRKIDKDILFLSGIDDTLLVEGGVISDYSRVELNRLIEGGVNFTVSTIRTPASLMEPLRGIRLSLPVIAMDGAVLYNTRENTFEKVFIIGKDHSRTIEEYFISNNIPFFSNVIIDDVLLIFYRDTDVEYYNDIVSRLRSSPYRNYIKRDVPSDLGVVYYMIADRTPVINEIYEKLTASDIFKNTKIICQQSTEREGCSMLKIYNHNATKENMIEYLKCQIGIEKTVTFGTVKGRYTYYIDKGDFDRVVKLIKKHR